MKVDGKIEGTDEVTACNAFFNLTTALNGSRDWPQKVQSDVRALFVDGSAAALPEESARFLHGEMKSTYEQVAKMNPIAQERLGVNQSRLGLFKLFLDDWDLALKSKRPLTISPIVQLPEADRRNEAELKKMLARFGVTATGDPLPARFKGRVVEYSVHPKNAQLVFVFLDDHSQMRWQTPIRGNLVYLSERGMKLQGLEGRRGELNYKAAYTADPKAYTQMAYRESDFAPVQTSVIEAAECQKDSASYLQKLDQAKKLTHAGYAAECLLGDQIESWGLEDAKSEYEKRQFATPPAIHSPLEAYHYQMKLLEFGIADGARAVKVLLDKMGQKQIPIAAMTYGLNHVWDIREALQKSEINYVIVSQ